MTLPFPTGIVAFTQQFPDEAACQRYLFALRFPDGFACPKCGVTRFSPYRGSLAVVQCPNHHLTSLTAGTIMHGSKQPLLTWFWAAYFVSTHTPGISAVQFQKHLQIHRYETAFHLLHKMRSALVAPDREPLHGVVEMDETYIQNKNQDRAIIIGAIEVRDRADPSSADYTGKKHAGGRLVETRPQVAGRLRLQVIPDETAVSFLGFATKNVGRGSVIHTDGDPSYNALGSLGYDHRPKVQGKGKSAVYGLDHLHRAFSNFKNWLSGTHHDAVLPKHIQAYANEYVFRHNRRGNPWAAFNRCLGLGASREAWPEYETLYRAGMPDGWTHPGRSPAAHFRVVSGCASPEAPCAPAREAPTLPPVGSRWFLHEGGDRPRDRAVKVTGYVNADAPGSERDPGAVFDWPVVLFEYEDTGEAGRLYLTAFAAGAVRAPPAQPPLREALERLADAHDVPTVSTARSTFAPAVAEELVRLGLARLGPPRFASQNEPSLDITPAGMDLYRRWSTRAGAPAAAHVEGPYHHLVYDERPNPRPVAGVTTALGRIAAMQDNPALVAWLAAHQADVDAILRGLVDPRDWEGT